MESNKTKKKLICCFTKAYPGSEYGEESRRKVFLNYFQWVPFLCLFSAGLFYLPRWIWLNYEGGEMEYLTRGLGKDKDYSNRIWVDSLQNAFR